ncbi:MAG: GerAB/ArcD/ProY family transporter [Clostridia bacterium]|nr:GerAB/ArcD/ProY family transporter [Clostridia bacterium]
MTNTKRLSVRQLCFIIITLFSVSKFYVLPAFVSGLSKEAGWMATSVNFALDYLILFACLIAVKNTDKTLYESSTEIFGKPLTNLTFILYAVYFIIKAFVPLLEQKNTISLTFYDSQPTLLIFMPFFIVAFYIAKKGVNAFSRSVEILLWVFALALLIIFALSIPAGKYQALLPFSQPPSRVFKGFYGNLIWFGDPVIVLFLGDYLTEKKKLIKKCTISFIISAVITISLIVVFYAIFDSIAERQYYAPIKMSKYSITLSNIGRLDYLGSILFSLISIYSITLYLLLATEIVNKVFKFYNNNFFVPLAITTIEALLIFFFQNEIFTSIAFVQKYFQPFFIVMAYLLPLVFTIATVIWKNKRRQNVQAC